MYEFAYDFLNNTFCVIFLTQFILVFYADYLQHYYVDGAFLVNCYIKILQKDLKDKKAIAIDLYKNRLIFFDFIDREFGWDIGLFQSIFPDGFPYIWAGIIHHPYTLKYWGTNLSSYFTLSSEYMKLCLRSCKFLIVLSPSLKNEIVNSGILGEFHIPVLIRQFSPLCQKCTILCEKEQVRVASRALLHT